MIGWSFLPCIFSLQDHVTTTEIFLLIHPIYKQSEMYTKLYT